MRAALRAGRDAAGGPRRAIDLEAFRLQNAGVIYAFSLIVLVFVVLTELRGRSDYLSLINIANVLDQASLNGILAVSMTVVLITGNFDLSIGSVAALSGALALSMLDGHGVAWAVAVGLGSGLALGLTNGILVQIVGINAFIVTLGTLTAVRGLVLLLTNGNSIDATSTALSPLSGPGPALNPQLLAVVAGLLTVGGGVWAARGRLRAERAPISAAHVLMIAGGAALAVAGKFLFATSWTLTTPVYLLASFTAAAWAVLRFTVAGRRLYATGGNAEAARLSGIAVNGYKIAAFALSGLAAASVGIIYAGKFNAINPNALTGTELTVLAAAILGGTSLFGGSGSVVKSVIGALILYTLSNGFNILNLGANYQGLIEGVVIVVAAGLYTVAGRRGARQAGAPGLPTAATGAQLPGSTEPQPADLGSTPVPSRTVS